MCPSFLLSELEQLLNHIEAKTVSKTPNPSTEKVRWAELVPFHTGKTKSKKQRVFVKKGQSEASARINFRKTLY